jgi:hypothetical protein
LDSRIKKDIISSTSVAPPQSRSPNADLTASTGRCRREQPQGGEKKESKGEKEFHKILLSPTQRQLSIGQN